MKNALKTTLPLLLLSILALPCPAKDAAPAYKNAALPVEERVRDLIAWMTLEEKVCQLRSDLKGAGDYNKRLFEAGHSRYILPQDAEPLSAKTCAEMLNDDQRRSMEANRLGIPSIQHSEALHGAQWGHATCFPQSIAMAASFDDALYYRVGQAVARELRAVGIRQVYAPVVNISRDPRWGRTQEGYGEDVLLNSRMGVAYTKALEDGGVIATPKHYVDNYGDGGHDSYASNTSWRVLCKTFLEPFRACIQEGGARSIMSAYNSIDGIPCSSNAILLNDILRGEWGFKGYVVSDYGAVRGIFAAHKTASDYAEAQAQAIEAGLDVEMHLGYPDLLNLVKQGRISEELINKSLARVLACKFQLGLFEEPFADPEKAGAIVRCEAHAHLALEAARSVMTLIKNDGNALPLDGSTLKQIGIFGPAANVASLGDYSSVHASRGLGVVTPRRGLVQRLAGKAKIVLHRPGQDIATLARECDAVIYFGAINEGEGLDRSRLGLPSKTIAAPKSTDNAIIIEGSAAPKDITIDQEEAIATLASTGVKTIVVLQNGSPVDVSNWIDKVNAVLCAWYPGEAGGTAVAEALLGDINPGGRLPMSWPRHGGQIPIYYNIKPSGRGYAYNDDDGKPRWPFGFGLSYTTFEYSNIKVPEAVFPGEDVVVKYTVRNTGSRAGDEVVQLYISRDTASVALPMMELRAYKRITLAPGEIREMALSLPWRGLGLWDKNLKFDVPPGRVNLMIGSNADEIHLKANIRI